jgi:hypothetical protein
MDAAMRRSSDRTSSLPPVATKHLSEHVLEQVRLEHPVVAARVADLREQSQRLHLLTERVDDELEEAMRMLRSIEEMLGLAPQLSLDAFHGELRGRRLRDIAVQILRQRRAPGDEVHYREWYDLVTGAGVRVAGKDPLATFLTQVSQAPGVESVRPRSGLYRLATV